jgi:hypothetical protein
LEANFELGIFILSVEFCLNFEILDMANFREGNEMNITKYAWSRVSTEDALETLLYGPDNHH